MFPPQEWNDNLAYLAQYSAGTCEYRQEENRNSQSAAGFDYVGRNVASTSSYTVNFTQVIAQQWYGEKRFFNYYSAACLDEDGNINENGEFETCGRYTQVWELYFPLYIFYLLLYTDGVGQNLCSRLWCL